MQALRQRGGGPACPLSSGLWPSAPASHRICWPSHSRKALAGSRIAPDTAGGEFHPAL